jgi:hypothetical protein
VGAADRFDASMQPSGPVVAYVQNFFDSAKRKTVRFDVDARPTITEILEGADYYIGDAVVTVDGYRIHRYGIDGVDMFRYIRPRPGTHVTVQCRPMGNDGGNEGKAAASIAIGVILVVVGVLTFNPAIAAGGGLSGFLAAGGGAAVSGIVSGAVSIGLGAYSLATPPPGVPYDGDVPTSKQSPNVVGTRNRVRLYTPVSSNYGVNRVFPNVAGRTFTQIVGSDVFMNVLLDFGIGPNKLTDIRIGETPIDQFDAEYNVLEGWDDDGDLEIYKRTVEKDSFGFRMGDTWVRRETRPSTRRAVFEFLFPQGLIGFKKLGEPRRARVVLLVQYRLAGTSDPWVDVVLTNADRFTGVRDGDADGEVFLTGMERGSVLRAFEFRFPSRDDWEVRVKVDRVVFPDEDEQSNIEESFTDLDWITLGSSRPSTKPTVPNITLLEVKLRLTEQFQGAVDTINAICSRVVHTYGGLPQEWGSSARLATNPRMQESRSPAWAYADALRGHQNPRRIDDDARIDAEALYAWDLYCIDEGRTFDAVVDFDENVYPLLNRIAGSNRAAFDLVDGKYSVVVNKEQSEATQVFAAPNLRNLRVRRVYRESVQAYSVAYIDPENGYEQVRRIVYNDGYSENGEEPGTVAPTRIAELDLWGVHDADIAYVDGRYHMASVELQPRTITFDVDVENLACRRGDRIRLNHDSMLLGLTAGRVQTVVRNQDDDVLYMVVNSLLVFEEGEAHACTLRTNDGVIYTVQLQRFPNTEAGDGSYVLWPEDPFDDAASRIEVDNLFTFGVSGKQDGDFTVTAIRRDSEFNATIECIDYNPAVFDPGPIPPFDPGITIPGPLVIEEPSKPTLLSVVSDESVLLFRPDGSFTPRVQVRFQIGAGSNVPTTALQVRYAKSGQDDSYRYLNNVAIGSGEFYVDDVEVGVAYDIDFRAINLQRNTASDWVKIDGHMVIGASTPPPAPTQARVEADTTLLWTYPDPLPVDFAGFLVRSQTGSVLNWATAAHAHEGIITVNRFDLGLLPAGERTVMIKSVDLAGNESEDFTYVVVDIDGLGLTAAIGSYDFKANTWPGTITDGTVSPSNTIEADAENNLFWGADSDLFWPNRDPFWTSGLYKTVTYECSWDVTPEDSLATKLSVDIDVTAPNGWVLEYRMATDGADDWKVMPAFVAFVSTPSSGSPDIYFRVTVYGGVGRGVINSMSVVSNAPYIEDFVNDFVVANSGTVRLTLNRSFRSIVEVLITVQDDSNGGVTARVKDKSTSGPSVEVLDASGSRVTGLIDARVRGT